MADMLNIHNLSAGYGAAVVLHGVSPASDKARWSRSWGQTV